MIPSPSSVRRSRVAYVVAKLRIRGDDYLLLNAHRKWGDWSLPGGHVESSDADFWAAAVRETTEELDPLRDGVAWDVEREPLRCEEWGPVASKSAGGVATFYQAAFHCLRFKVDPRRCLDRLSETEFRLIRVRDVKPRAGWPASCASWRSCCPVAGPPSHLRGTRTSTRRPYAAAVGCQLLLLGSLPGEHSRRPAAFR
jgi:8-oxo-dGTP pyrophosphatase MutT (NUDIX family)